MTSAVFMKCTEDEVKRALSGHQAICLSDSRLVLEHNWCLGEAQIFSSGCSCHH